MPIAFPSLEKDTVSAILADPREVFRNRGNPRYDHMINARMICLKILSRLPRSLVKPKS